MNTAFVIHIILCAAGNFTSIVQEIKDEITRVGYNSYP